MTIPKQLYRKLPYPVKCLWMDFREGLSSFRCAIFYRCTSAESWDPNGCFWEEINLGWYRQYIYPYDDYYNPRVSEQRKLRLGQKPRGVR